MDAKICGEAHGLERGSSATSSAKRALAYVRFQDENTYMSKLTLSVDEAVVERAKRYAARRGTSVSRLVEGYLDSLARRPVAAGEEALPPITRRLSGILKGSRLTREDYRRHLERKYR